MVNIFIVIVKPTVENPEKLVEGAQTVVRLLNPGVIINKLKNLVLPIKT